jgi:hypothetical protein
MTQYPGRKNEDFLLVVVWTSLSAHQINENQNSHLNSYRPAGKGWHAILVL